jgi:hypothetical protein
MTDLSVFNEDSGSEDLSSFSSTPVEKSVDSKLSNTTVATQGAILSGTGDRLIEVFNSLSEAPEEERSAMMDSITAGVQQETSRISMDIAAQMTLDPDISMEERESLVRAMSGLSKDVPNSMDLMADQMGILPSGDEDFVSEDIRLDAVEISKAVHGRLRQKQELLNGNLLSTNKGGMHALADLLEIVVPLSESFITDQTIRDMRGGSVAATAEAFTLLGNAKADLRDHYMSLSSDNQVLFEQKLATVVNESRGIVFTNDNDLAQKDLFMSVVDGNYYGGFDQGLDNVIGILDLVGVGSLLKPLKIFNATTKLSKLGMRKIRSGVQPTSTAKVVGEVNPDEARKMQAIVESDSTDEAAEALTGASREEAIANAELPQVQMPDGSVENIPYNLSKYVEEFVEGGRIDLSVDELRSAQRKQVERLQAVNGITNRTNMALQPKIGTDGRTTYQNVYGPADSSYRDPQHGIDNVMFSMRDYGIEETDLTILQKVGDEYVPTTMSEVSGKRVLREGFVKSKKKLPEELKKENFQEDYLVQVNFQHDFDPMDVSWDKLQVKRNFFDRIPYFNRAKKGSSSVQRHLVDIHSMLDPRLTLGANVAVERSSAIETSLLKISQPFTEGFRGMEKERQVALLDVINNNNFTGKVTPKSKLKADGYSPSEIELLDKWKESWDQLYHLENTDLVKTLKGAGYQKFVDDANDTNLVARKVGRGGAESAGRVYDSATNSLRRITTDELNALYADGGTLAKTRSTEKLGTSDFDYVIVRNKENNSLLRDIQEHDRVLNYREGYYTVRYKDPHIITRNHLDKDGRVTRSEAVETADSKKTAELAVANFTRGNTDSGVSSSGRTSQRLRGARLGTTDTNIQSSKLGAVEGPAEALLNSVRSVSRRTSMRDYIERYKLRFMNDYDDLLKIDPASGQRMFPNHAEDFRTLEGSSNKHLADARTNLEYINYLENGYRNGLDDSWKVLLNGVADVIGGKTKYGEKFVRATVDEIQSPSSWFKARAFDAYLALNPVRQFVVQGHQASLLAANFPKYVLSQKMAKDSIAIHLAMITKGRLKDVKGLEKLIGMKAEDALALAEEYRKTGFDAAIDRNNLVENGLDYLVETDRWRRTKTVHKAVVGTARKYGFDAGERINIMTSWLAHRNRALEEGKDITELRVRDEILAKSRNYTFNMNAAGDMPYNKNSLALLFQFMQVPHKAMLQMTNRALTRTERAKLGVYNAVMLPLPVGIGYSIISEMGIENEETRDVIANGIEGYVFNKAAQLMFDDDTRVDFSSLAAVDPNAPVDLIHGLLTSDVGEAIGNTPALSLWAGFNPRATNIITETYKFVTEPQNASIGEGLALMETFAHFSSGYANASKSVDELTGFTLSKAYRGLAVQEYDRRYNSSAGITASNLTSPEKFAKIFGFGTLREAYHREAKQELYQKSQAARDDVKAVHRKQKQLGAKRGLNVDHPEYSQHMMRAFWAATDFSAGQQEEYLKLMNKDITAGEDGVLNLILRNLNNISADELRDIAIGAGVEDQITNTLDVIDSAETLGE